MKRVDAEREAGRLAVESGVIMVVIEDRRSAPEFNGQLDYHYCPEGAKSSLFPMGQVVGKYHPDCLGPADARGQS